MASIVRGAVRAAGNAGSNTVDTNTTFGKLFQALFPSLKNTDAPVGKAWDRGRVASDIGRRESRKYQDARSALKSEESDLRSTLMHSDISPRERRKMIDQTLVGKRAEVRQIQQKADQYAYEGTLGRVGNVAKEYYFGNYTAGTLATRWGATGVGYIGAATVLGDRNNPLFNRKGDFDIAGIPFI